MVRSGMRLHPRRFRSVRQWSCTGLMACCCKYNRWQWRALSPRFPSWTRHQHKQRIRSEFRALPLPLRYNPPQKAVCFELEAPVMEVSFTAIVVLIIVVYLLSSIKILAEYERGVIFRLGRLLSAAKGPGVILVFTPIDRMGVVSLRHEALEVPAQDIITRDHVTL